MAERATLAQQREVSDFLDAVLMSRPMQYAHAYLAAKARPLHSRPASGPKQFMRHASARAVAKCSLACRGAREGLRLMSTP